MTYEAQRWQLKDLLPPAGTPEMKAKIEALEQQVTAFEDLRERLSPAMDAADFVDVVARYEELYAHSASLMAYSYLWFSEDTDNQDAIAFRARVQQLLADFENRTLFFTLWWKQLDDEAAARLLAVSGDTRYFLESLRLLKPHTLSEIEEQVINTKNVNGVQALLTAYDLITNRLTFPITVEGEEQELTRGQLMAHVFDPAPERRAAAYQSLYRVYGQHTHVLAHLYAARVRDWTAENVKLREFTSPISVRNLQNDIPDPVVDTLLDVIRQNAALFQRYFRLKARALGLDRLRRYDIYAPLAGAKKAYTFDDAVRLVDQGYRAFSPELADTALRVLDTGHLDAQVRANKMDGAYCYGPRPDLVPWVLVNFTGKIHDVSTLAHELGHAVHAMMASDHSPLTFHSSLPMAETASVFGEMLLTDKLLNEERDPAVRRTLLSDVLGEAYATITRQGYFVIFENEAHRMILEGATADQLNAAYLNNLREQFGDAVELSEDFQIEWTAIPHIYHTPFYCYAYAFGNLLVLALYRKYKELGQAFVPDYLRILTHGGSASPDFIISEAGFDMRAPSFWQGGFDLLAEMLDELETYV